MQSVFRPGLFRGRKAIVTGGGTGIGLAIARELVGLECGVVIAGRNQERLVAAQESLRGSAVDPSTVQYCVCNIRDETAVRELMQFASSSLGGLDLLVNNAGGQFPSPAAKISLKGWQAVIDTNLTGTFLCCREAYEGGMRENGGAIVNIVADYFNGLGVLCKVAKFVRGLLWDQRQGTTAALAQMPGAEWEENTSFDTTHAGLS